MKDFRVRTIIYNEDKFIVVFRKRTMVSLASMGKFLPDGMFTNEVLRRLRGFNGAVIFINGKNVVHYPTIQDAQNAAEYINSLCIMGNIME